MSVSVEQLLKFIWTPGKSPTLDETTGEELVQSWIDQAVKYCQTKEPRMSGTDQDTCVIEIGAYYAFRYLNRTTGKDYQTEMQNTYQTGNDLIATITKRLNNSTTESTQEDRQTGGIFTAGALPNDILRDIPGSDDTVDRSPMNLRRSR